ncbi:Mrp/NBP35 family ATP-binding protein [Pedomonas mirosovicensis]|uniref:Mrp/NBP35 family ATP-binding protein n=1 Tax=Pedomonas mirosovicensis TaxID=2908641 RepID=UPI002166DECF|nr:Mrp/NBP35 family ATP-binding protein [Pedomonas mirosovicensis]MCH8684591.1 Mrp/NBP35 family ATP-binding protein [Pedomonas mirosovicensis]
MTISREAVLDTLRSVIDPATGRDIVSSGLVTGLTVRGEQVGFILEVEPAAARTKEPLREAAENAVRAMPGVKAVTVVLTAERPPEEARAAAHGHAAPAQHGSAGRGAPSQQPAQHGSARPAGIAQVERIIAVASGKGGVGKSTVAANVALSLAHLGLNVGLLDADIYGPSVPKLLGINQKPETDGKMLQPLEAFGIKAMSIGMLVDTDTAMIWRGPMATSALMQMMADVAWGPLDVLVLDMPPGTGDIQLTLAQRTPLSGALIVSTPQDLALIDARKAVTMFRQVKVPVLGIVENMSTFVCPHCGTSSHIFGHGGAWETAAQIGVPFLGEVPLTMQVRECSDKGHPVVVCDPASTAGGAFLAIADQVLASFDTVNQKSLPIIRLMD